MSWTLGFLIGWVVEPAVTACLGQETAQRFTGGKQKFLDRIAKRPPGNHDIERAIRTAQLQAMQVSLNAYRTLVEAMRPHEPVDTGFNTKGFIRQTEDYLGKHFTYCFLVKVDEEFVKTVRGDVSSDISLGTSGEAADGDLHAVLIDAAKAAFRKASGHDVLPDRFCQILAEGSGSFQSWPDLYRAFLCEQVKANARFAAILNVAILESVAEDVKGLPAFQANLEETLATVAKQQQTLLGAVGEALARAEYGATSAAELADIVTKVVAKGTEAVIERIEAPIDQIISNMFRDLDRSSSGSDTATFHYTQAQDPLVGRATIIERIERDLLDAGLDSDAPPPFLWMALCGEGGTGKSRLARELVTRNGHVWLKAGFVQPDFLKKTDRVFEVGNRLARPILLVVDYAVSQRTESDLVSFLQAWASYAHSPNARPVRAIVITRRDKEPLLEELRGKIGAPGRDMSKVKEVGFSPLVLDKLAEDQAVALMRERIRLTAHSANAEPIAIDDKTLIDALDRFDDRRRPLFAAMVAAELQKGTLPGSSASQESNRLALFGGYLLEQNIRYWLPAAQALETESSANVASKHVNLVRLATCCGDVGISLLGERVPEPVRNGQGPFPKLVVDDGQGTIHSTLVESMTGESVKVSPTASPFKLEPPPKIIPRLEPDLIGERLLLMTGDEAASMPNLTRPEAIAGLSWSLAPEATATFLRLTTQDYPNRMHALTWLPPDPKDQSPETMRARAKLLRNICADIATRYGRAEVAAADLTRMFDIVDAFTPAMIALTNTDDDCRAHYGAVLSQVANTASRLANASIRYRDPISAVEEKGDTATERSMVRLAFAQSRGAEGSGAEKLDAEAVRLMPADLQDIVVSRLSPLLDHAAPFLAQPGPYNEREPFLLTVRDVLGSVHFLHRHDGAKGGRWPTPRDDTSTKVLQNLRDLANGLAGGNIDDICVMAGLVSVLAYAEYETAVEEYLNIYPAISAALRQVGRLDLGGASRILSMLSNALAVPDKDAKDLSDHERVHFADSITIFLQLAALLDLSNALQSQIVSVISNLTTATLHAVYWGKKIGNTRVADVVRALADLIATAPKETHLAADFLSVLGSLPQDLPAETVQALQDAIQNRLLAGAIDVEDFSSPTNEGLHLAMVQLVFGLPDPQLRLQETVARDLLGVLDEKVGAKSIRAALEAVATILVMANDKLAQVPLDLAKDYVARQQNLRGFDPDDLVASAKLTLWGCDIQMGRLDPVQDEIAALWHAQPDGSASPGRILALWGVAMVFDATRAPSEFTANWAAWLQTADTREPKSAQGPLSDVDLGPEDVESYNLALVDACMAAARRHIILGGDAADWRKELRS